ASRTRRPTILRNRSASSTWPARSVPRKQAPISSAYSARSQNSPRATLLSQRLAVLVHPISYLAHESLDHFEYVPRFLLRIFLVQMHRCIPPRVLHRSQRCIGIIKKLAVSGKPSGTAGPTLVYLVP